MNCDFCALVGLASDLSCAFDCLPFLRDVSFAWFVELAVQLKLLLLLLLVNLNVRIGISISMIFKLLEIPPPKVKVSCTSTPPNANDD